MDIISKKDQDLSHTYTKRIATLTMLTNDGKNKHSKAHKIQNFHPKHMVFPIPFPQLENMMRESKRLCYENLYIPYLLKSYSKNMAVNLDYRKRN
jgi:hypothetical protein